MRILAVLFGFLACLNISGAAFAQDTAWLQVEALPDLAKAEERVRAYAALLPDVEGYQTGSGWYAITVGPMAPDQAAARLVDLRRQNLIPYDSFIVDGSAFGTRFWPVGADGTDITVVAPTDPAGADTAVVLDPAPVALPDETAAEARASEAALSAEDRQALQTALQWYGFYDSTIDGAFGAGTRKSMAAWQEAKGYEPTGILTTAQRAELLGNYSSDQAEFGFATIDEAESGIEITLPMALISFDTYQPPFVNYVPKGGSGLKVLLISQPGEAASLAGLYDVLQSLEMVPPAGERLLAETSFTIEGHSAKVSTYAYAETAKGTVKGYVISWNPADQARMDRILPVLKASFRSLGSKAMDPGLVPLAEAARRGLLAGLDVRKPKLSRSGFFVDGAGTVLTTFDAVKSCGRITIERDSEATVAFSDAASGLALLTPATPLAPPAVAVFAAAPAQKGAEITVAGYSYEDKLPAPVLTFGTLEETTGLNGEPGLTRLSVPVLAGDAGGPVLDAEGAVLGMLLPAGTNAARKLPAGVAFAASASALGPLLAQAGIIATISTARAPATPDALQAAGLGMTVLVSCWE